MTNITINPVLYECRFSSSTSNRFYNNEISTPMIFRHKKTSVNSNPVNHQVTYRVAVILIAILLYMVMTVFF